MAVAIALWSLALTPGEPESFTPPGDIRITNVALGDELADESGRTTVKLVYRHPEPDSESEDEEDEKDEESIGGGEPITTVLCSLTPGKIEQSLVNIVLEAEQEVLFQAVGKNTVYLAGNYIDQRPGDEEPYPDEDSDSDEEGYHLGDVSSDVEVNPEELEVPSDDNVNRFEEVHSEEEEEEKPKPAKDSKKRPRESDTMDTDGPKLSKAERKKLKKLKADENGKAVTTATDEKPSEAKANGDVKEKKEKKDKKKEKKEKEGGGENKTKTKELEGGLKIRDHKLGTGRQAKNGDTVSVRYVGKLENGKVFDSNTKGKPFTFHLGKGEVIKGWDLGVAGMQVGGERLITVPAPLAYGNKKQTGIPAGSTLIFEVKLLKIG